ncbi:MAG: hypothetical protein Solumvirus2_59 [Solumvirus sp.]|uniref:Uncharacterized protein n=1 Tax=Solumvirus sp. TaxID=2487773 RepID=A0A3G5AGF0_9VIRU|nr:MAG: hypothetical protein Solumvirus2_59 [Solumvirus sp.]
MCEAKIALCQFFLSRYIQENAIVNMILNYEGTTVIKDVKEFIYQWLVDEGIKEFINIYNWDYLISTIIGDVAEIKRLYIKWISCRPSNDPSSQDYDDIPERLDGLVRFDHPLLTFNIDLDSLPHRGHREYECKINDVEIFLRGMCNVKSLKDD